MRSHPNDRQLLTRDKAKAESAVQIVEHWSMAHLLCQQFDSVHGVMRLACNNAGKR
jgi:hypothetical protein